MRRLKSRIVPLGAACCVALGAVFVGCIIPLNFVKTGVIYSNMMEIYPRHMYVNFFDDVADVEALALIDSFGATYLHHSAGWNMYYVQTPIGASLQEACDHFEASELVEYACPSMFGCMISAGGHRLVTENDELYWLFHDDWDYLDGFMREWVVEVRGIQTYDNLEGAPAVEVYSVRIIEPNYLTFHGTITLAGPSDEYLLLVDDSGDVWELLGSAAEEIAGLSDIDGAGVTVTGIDKGVSTEAHSGGLQLEVSSYQLD